MQTMDAFLDKIRNVATQALRRTRLGVSGDDLVCVVTGGKLLRARLGGSVGLANRIAESVLVPSLAAVEIVHAASLLHDDVIDGSLLRRHAPAFWVEKGTAGAILLGDLLVCRAMELVVGAGVEALTREFAHAVSVMCEAEAEQELLSRNQPGTWVQCLDFARRKTGSLFGLAAWIGAGTDAVLGDALREAGYRVGTAYQLADDLLDTRDVAPDTDKTPGADRRRGKPTCATTWRVEGVDPLAVIRQLCAESETALDAWPRIRQAWHECRVASLDPVLERATRHVQLKAVS